ncbi:hypothetical protein [Vreelandella venusta]|nr:hypothetical protein [Halomonas venusta]QPI64363.1 hypothetical protein IR195_01110 [Halomonas venusta]
MLRFALLFVFGAIRLLLVLAAPELVLLMLSTQTQVYRLLAGRLTMN